MKIRIGLGSCGIAAGAEKVKNRFEELLKGFNEKVDIVSTGCIGLCYIEPIIDIIDEKGTYTYGNLNLSMVDEIFNEHVLNKRPIEKYLVATDKNPHPEIKKQVRIVLRNCGIIDPEDINEYVSSGGYSALKKVLFEMTPDKVIEELKISGLRGRGGAGFPAWLKWQTTRNSKGTEKYIVCNADEGDPGAFMDRSVIEGDPHSVIEGMIIAAYAIGAHEGFVYVRAEYPLAVKRLNIALNQAREHNFLGNNILNSGFDFDIKIKMGAGAFVCGEETALIASLEGERGMPRPRPPFPAQSGYRGRPTNINNVETYANVPWIIVNGGKEFAKYGTEKSKGTKVFALAGKIKNGGLVEVPMGITLREVIYEIGGGIKNDKEFKAVQLGGPSGGCIPKELLDTHVDYESITSTGAIMGSGGMIVMDETTCMVDIARFFLDFTSKESCGKCVPCRLGTKRMLEILEKITEGKGTIEDLDILEELCYSVKDGSLCGLGQTAPNPVLTTLKYFKEEYIAHVKDKKCPSKQCKNLIKYKIIPDKCVGCTLCARVCPVSAISGIVKQPHVIDEEKCIKCGNCKNACKFDAIYIE